MIFKLKDIADDIFASSAYSEKSESLKERVTTEFQAEYSRLTESGENEIQAVGSIMQRFGSLEKACGLVNEEIPLAEESISEKAFRRSFRQLKINSVILAWVISGNILSAVQGVIQMNPLYFLTISFYLAIGIIPLKTGKKISLRYSYDKICLSPEAREVFYIFRDRYKKRLLNSVFILVGAVVYLMGMIFGGVQSGMNHAEILVLVDSVFYIPSLALLLLIKNILCCRFLTGASPEKDRISLQKYFRRLVLIAGGFLVVLTGVSAVLSANRLSPVVLIYISGYIFIITGIVINFMKRSSLVRKNIRINKPRIAVFTAVAVVFAFVNYLKQDVYVLRQYIDSVSRIDHKNHDIFYDNATGVYTITADSGDFKILHLTDIHLGGSLQSSYKDYHALEACRKLMEYTQPDFVVVTGDMAFPMGIMSLSLNNETPVREFASFMRNTGIPWAFTFGNHDTESIATGTREEICHLYESLSYKTSGNLLFPYIQPDITGRSNQLIKIENPDGSIRQALFLIDSNDYTGEGINDYDFIHDDQVDWYAEKITGLQAQQPDVKSMAFFHIPLQQYRTAYELYEKGSEEVTYYFGENGETMINKVCCSDYPSKFFDTALALGSTQAMFCGHDHYNNLSVGYKGIRLTYGMSIDYLAMPGIDKDTRQRGGELITLHPDASYDLIQIPLTEIE